MIVISVQIQMILSWLIKKIRLTFDRDRFFPPLLLLFELIDRMEFIQREHSVRYWD